MNHSDKSRGRKYAVHWMLAAVASLAGFALGSLKRKTNERANGSHCSDSPDISSSVTSAPLSQPTRREIGLERAPIHYIEIIQKILGAVAGLVGIIYVLGFVIVNFSLEWNYHFFEPNLLSIRYLGAGLFYFLYTLFVLIWLYTSIAVSQQSALKNSRRLKVTWFTVTLFCLLVLGFFFFSSIAPGTLQVAVDADDAFPWWSPGNGFGTDGLQFGESSAGLGYIFGDFAVGCSFYIILSYIFYSLGVWEIYRLVHWDMIQAPRHSLQWMTVIVSVIGIPLLLALYSIFLYPNLYAAVGGGCPQVAQLMVHADLIDETSRLFLGWVSPSETTLVQIVDQTPDSYVLDPGVYGAGTIQLPKEIVSGVVYYPAGIVTLSDAYVSRGWKEFGEGKYFKALEWSSSALDSNRLNSWALYLQGRAYFALGDRHHAISSLSKTVRLMPSLDYAQSILARLWLEDGQFDAARTQYEDCLATLEVLDPMRADDAYRGLGETFLAQLDLASAIIYFERAVEVDPGDDTNRSLLIKAYAADATRYLLQLDFLAAKDRFRSALDIEPDSFRVQEGLAMMYLQSGEPDMAMIKMEELVDNYPFSPYVHLDRALVFSNVKRSDLALPEFERAVQLEPNLSEFVQQYAQFQSEMESSSDYLQRGVMRMGIRDWLGALNDLDRSIQLNAEDPLSYVNRAFVYDQFDLHDRAIEDFDSAIQRSGSDPLVAVALCGRGAVYNELGRLSEAIADYELAMDLMPGLSWPHFEIAWVYYRQNRFEDQLRELDKALRLIEPPQPLQSLIAEQMLFDPFGIDEEGIYRAKATASWAQKKMPKAIEYMKRAIELDPGDSYYYRELASLYQDNDEPNAAKSTYEVAISKWPDLPWFYYECGLLLAEEEEWEVAEKQFKAAIQIYSGYAPAYYQLGNLYSMTERSEEATMAYTTCIEAEYSQNATEACRQALERVGEK